VPGRAEAALSEVTHEAVHEHCPSEVTFVRLKDISVDAARVLFQVRKSKNHRFWRVSADRPQEEILCWRFRPPLS
jgi:hypothetical protein